MTLSLTDADGNPTVSSYWGTVSDLDGGLVNEGGVGALLLTNSSRNIYTYDGDANHKDLNGYTSNSFSVTSGSPDVPNVSAATLDVATDEAAVKLINFIRGEDAFGSDPSAMRPWPGRLAPRSRLRDRKAD